MAKYFGTDGIRGEFRTKLTIDLAARVGMAAGSVFIKANSNAVVCIAKDPRESSNPLENALVGGLTSQGVDVVLLGFATTPLISHAVINNDEFIAGIMISASHNPFTDNGIKFFGKDGKKLSDDLEAAIEAVLESQEYVNSESVGLVTSDESCNLDYIDYLKNIAGDLSGLKIGLDLANGSSCFTAGSVFEKLGAQVTTIGNNPDGRNINLNVGSTHPEALCELVKNEGLDFGFAFDGDGDRVMLVDQDGDVLDGDYIIYLLAKQLKSQGKLKNDLVVGTVMANLGFVKAIKELDAKLVLTAVGDRYVMQAITEQDANLGGEQSGHIILPDLLPTGDGILTACFLANMFKEDLSSLTNLKTDVAKFPQVLVNLYVENKNNVMNDVELLNLIDTQEAKLEGEGRILVRASGTEEMVRVMIEAKTDLICNQIIEPIIEKINNF